MKDILVDGFKVVCHGAQSMVYKKKYCDHCPLIVRAKYPPCEKVWRVWGIIKRGGECNIKRILKI